MKDCEPDAPVVIPRPKQWSYSSIRSFQLCPLRWVLSNEDASNQKRTFSIASIEGDLVHKLIQSYFERDPSEPFRKSRVLKQLTAVYPEHNQDDRGIVKDLVQKVSTQDILFGFIRALETIRAENGDNYTSRKRTPIGVSFEETSQPRGSTFTNGVEKWIELPDMALCGRPDYYINGVLIDFKSGAEHEWHQEQVVFYCALIYKKFGKPPTRAKIFYTGSGVSVEVPVPSPTQCEEVLIRYSHIATAAANMLRSGTAEALPDRDNCSFCPCKPRCEKYWRVIVPQLLQDTNLSIVDVFVPAEAIVVSRAAYLSVIFSASYGSVEVLFPRHSIHGLIEEDLTGCWVLRARKRQVGKLISVVLTDQSEVFPAKAGG